MVHIIFSVLVCNSERQVEKKVVARCNQATDHETEELPLLYICWRYDMSIVGGSGGVVVM